MSMERRIEKLEKRCGADEGKGPAIVYVLHDNQREPSQEEKERAMRDYVKKYGAVQPELAIIVSDEEAKNMLERVMAGDRTEKTG